jgi:4,5-dihydroxyphthalate decarboxylase
VKITYSVNPTALTEPLQSGEVKPDGLELAVTVPKTTDANSRDMIQLRFDVAEMSIATFTKAVERGLPLVGLPVFTSGRRFVQSGFFFSTKTDVAALDQLRGRTVGLPQYWISSCIWQRMVLQEMYGVSPGDVRWVSEAPERFEGVAPPPGVELRMESGRDLAALAGDGSIDALLMPRGPLPAALAAVTTPAFADCVAAERECYLARRVFPIMHVTVMQRELASNGAVVSALLDAYSRAKELAQARADADWSLPPLTHDIQGLRQLVGGDPFGYGITANRAALDAFLDGAVAQGLLGRRPQIGELFIQDLPEKYR